MPIRLVPPFTKGTALKYLTSFILLLVSSLPLAQASQEIDQHASQQALRELKSNIKSLKAWLDNANSEKSGLAKRLKKIEQDIGQTSLKIRELRAQGIKLNRTLTELQSNEREQTNALKQQTRTLTKQLKALYLQGKQPALKLLLDSDDPQNLSRYINYFSYLNDARGDKIETFKLALKQLEETRRDVLLQKTKLVQNEEKLRKRQTQLKTESKQRKQILAKLEESIISESARLKTLRADQVRLEKLLEEVEQAIANLALPSDASPFAQQKSKLPWPTRGKVLERFGSRIAQGKLRSNGIRIATQENAPVQAVHHGRVIFADWLRGFGLLLIIDHGEGYMSLYGNNNSLLKETGDWVSAGDRVSYSGNSGGARQSGLYFEIRRHGKPQNPSKWLRK